jgi:hypothetical protein
VTVTITPALIDAVGRHETDGDIDTYIHRHGVAGLAMALTYAVARERTEATHRLMAENLSISPLAAEMILQALRPWFTSTTPSRKQGRGLMSWASTVMKVATRESAPHRRHRPVRRDGTALEQPLSGRSVARSPERHRLHS